MKIMIVRELDIYLMSHLNGLNAAKILMHYIPMIIYSHYKFDVVMLLQYTFVCCYNV